MSPICYELKYLYQIYMSRRHEFKISWLQNMSTFFFAPTDIQEGLVIILISV